VLELLAHDRRRIRHVAVTAHPTAAWMAQQLREGFPWLQSAVFTMDMNAGRPDTHRAQARCPASARSRSNQASEHDNQPRIRSSAVNVPHWDGTRLLIYFLTSNCDDWQGDISIRQAVLPGLALQIIWGICTQLAHFDFLVGTAI
jgi:hypothetical protein